MALFKISKKVEDKLSDVVGKETAAKVMDKVERTCGEALSGLCNVKVLGSGCKNCHNLFEAATEAVNKLGLPVKVEYVTDMAEVAKYGAMRMPALVVNDKVPQAAEEVLSILKAQDCRVSNRLELVKGDISL